jgi:hypothetical protein
VTQNSDNYYPVGVDVELVIPQYYWACGLRVKALLLDIQRPGFRLPAGPSVLFLQLHPPALSKSLSADRTGTIVNDMPQPKEVYRILFSGDNRCGKTSLRARIAGQAMPNSTQLTFLPEFHPVECLVPNRDPGINENTWEKRQTRAVEGPTGGGVGGGRTESKEKRAKIESQENSLGTCYDGFEALNFLGMDVVAICFSVGKKDTFEERLQIVCSCHFTLVVSPQRKQSDPWILP